MKHELTALEKIQAVYDMEINAKIGWFWDGGYEVIFGDHINGYGEQMGFERLEDAADWLYQQALKKIVNI